MSGTPRPPQPWPVDGSGRPKRRVGVPGSRGVYWRADGLFEVGYRDADGRQRWRGPFETLTSARLARDDARVKARGGERESANPRLKFGEAADRWLSEQVVELRPATRASYTSYLQNHLRPRWGNRRMDAIDVTDAARMVRELRAAGLAEWTISGICRAASRVFKFARRHCSWRGDNPFAELETGERPRPSTTPERRIYVGGELAQVLAAATEPWRTLFRLASVVGGRESELLGLWWEDFELGALDRATIRFSHQVGRDGKRVALKTEESKATLPLPRSTALMLLEHKARTPAPISPRSYVFSTRIGRPIHQRNVLRALYRAQERARTPDGQPTFPELFQTDRRGHLVFDADGDYVPREVKRRELHLPDFHALRDGAAMDCDDAEEARDLLRHKNSNVTRAIYRAHFGDRRRELLRARMETRMETSAVGDEPDGTGASAQQSGIKGAA
ncbi:tyrosine-type recombinase/integrase [Solirubrobacter soli]|uniref:tyrosine-type recombinase/integrase n=1 Tax=Solirubrobacter soli TaxID=363832 RepID=UPI0009FF87C0|nr:site-specific integrase [Solirubrobacter soli]